MRKEYIEDLENEIWIENNGYEVSNKGRIIGKKGKLLKCNPNKDGYLQCSVTFDDGFHAGSAHRAVAHIFIPNPNDLPEVNHKDGIKHHNYDSNLEWVTTKENQEHEARVLQKRNGENNYNKKLTDEKVIEIYNLCKDTNVKHKDIAKMYGVIPQEINLIIRGICWKHLNLEPLPKIIQGSRSRGKPVIWINEDKEYPSISQLIKDIKNTYNIEVSNYIIKRICNNKLNDYEKQQFKWAQ